MTSLKANMAWANQFNPDLERIIRRVGVASVAVIRDATQDEDMNQAFDKFFTIDMSTSFQYWAVRVRRPTCHWYDLTIRLPNGPWRSEYHKIMDDGLGDAYLYGWTTHQSAKVKRLSDFIVVDLNKFRQDREWVDNNSTLIQRPGENPFYAWKAQALDQRGLLVENTLNVEQQLHLTLGQQ